jgi:O-acetyl-ADP-ribose deacetylase (regulator of RNase III)
MIEYRYGCVASALKLGEISVIAHQANCFNTMNSGVAKAIRQLYPEVYAADCKTVKGDHRKLGGFTMATTLDGLVFNLYGQYDYGRDGKQYTDYEALRSSLKNMAYKLRHLGFLGKIGIPKLGCGLGGGDWEGEVKLIVEQTLGEWDVIVYEL